MIRYFIGRVGSVVLTFLVGTSLLFVISRLSPTNPVDVIISKLTAAGAYLTPEAYESIKGTFMKLYGLDKPLFEQYVSFMRGLTTGELGPSFSHFPTPVIDLIYRALPWTVGLLVVSLAIAWVLGNLIGVAAGYFEQKRFTKILEGGSLIVSLVPYPVIALGLAFLFIYFIPIFPFFGGMSPGTVPGFSLEFILGIVKHAFLPAFSIILVTMGASVITMRALTISVKTEDFVEYAELRGLPPYYVLWRYILRNSLLPQVTGLALSLGQVFSGALAVEYIFAYPGLGQLSYYAIVNGDYNLMVGIAFLSIVGISIAILLLELLYPLIDPRTKAA